MKDLLPLLLGAALAGNVALAKFLGICPLMGASRRPGTAVGTAAATALVLTLAAAACHLADRYLLLPAGLGHLRTVTFIVIIAAAVQFTEMVVRKTSPLLFQAMGIFLPLIATNCAVLGVALLNTQSRHSFVESLVYGFGSAAGFSLVLVLFAAVRERVGAADVPAPFRGTAIALITLGLVSMAFMGFSGFAKG